MATAVLGTIAAVLAIACGWLAWRNQGMRRDARAADNRVRTFGERTARAEAELAVVREKAARLEASVSALSAERTALLAERDGSREDHERLAAAQDRLEHDLRRARTEHAAALDALAGERERVAAAERATTDAAVRSDEYRALLDSLDAAGSRSEVPGATWAILLATLARRWAAVVGAPPEDRGVRAGSVPEQLVEALARESERLREEVGVDVAVRIVGTDDPAAPAPGGATVAELADPVTFLLAATDVLGVLAAECERVVIDLGDGLTLTGEGWSGPTGELELARARAAASGMNVDDVTVGDQRVSLTLRPRATATA